MNLFTIQRNAGDRETFIPAIAAPHGDCGRLEGQNAAILAMLRRGPATNGELAGVSLKYTSRISDVRKWLKQRGEDIECTRLGKGACRYRIVRAAPAVAPPSSGATARHSQPYNPAD